MFEISSNGIITVSRGDSFTLNVFVNIGTVLDPLQYSLSGEDKLYFGLMEANQPFECALIRKMYSEEDQDAETGMVAMRFVPDDTEFLLPGKYYYMVKLVRVDAETGAETVDTIITKTRFIILD